MKRKLFTVLLAVSLITNTVACNNKVNNPPVSTNDNIFVITINMIDSYQDKFYFHGLDIDSLADKDNISNYKVTEWEKWVSKIQMNPDVTPVEFWKQALVTGNSRSIVKEAEIYNGKIINPERLIYSLEN